MKSSVKILAAAMLTAAAVSLTSCSAPNGYSYSNIGITISVACSDCPAIAYNPTYPQPPAAGSAVYMANGGQGGTIALTAAVTNAPPSSVTWSIYPTPNLTTPNPPPTSGSGSPSPSGSAVGTFNTPSGVSNTTATGAVAYYSNGGIPIYSGLALQQAQALGIPQGDVLVVATVPSDPNNPSATVSLGQLIQIYNSSSTTPTIYLSPAEPTSPAGLTSSVVSVTRNKTFQFYGGAAGEQPCLTANACGSNPLYTADNTVIWEVGATPQSATATCNTPGVGNCPYGWVSSTGLYTAPPTVPSGGQAAVVVASHFLQTITKFAYVGIN